MAAWRMNRSGGECAENNHSRWKDLVSLWWTGACSHCPRSAPAKGWGRPGVGVGCGENAVPGTSLASPRRDIHLRVQQCGGDQQPGPATGGAW
jgi:hypothetical protein